MNDCCNKPIKLAQGTTLALPYRYGAEPLVYKAISAKTADTPLTLTVTGHGLPPAWDVWLTDVGYDDLNAAAWPPIDEHGRIAADPLEAAKVDADTVTLSDVDLDRFEGTWTNGKIVYLSPVDLAGASASLVLYADGSPVLTIAGALDNTAKTISFTITPVQSTALAVGDYTYAATFTDSLAAVATLDEGAITVYAQGSPP